MTDDVPGEPDNRIGPVPATTDFVIWLDRS